MCSSLNSLHFKSARSGFVVYRVCSQPNRKQITGSEQLTECWMRHTQHTTTFYIHFSQSHLLQLILYMVLGEFSYATFSDCYCYVWNFKYFNGYNVQHHTPYAIHIVYEMLLNWTCAILYYCGVVWCGKAASSIHRQIKVVQKKGQSFLLVCDTKMKEKQRYKEKHTFQSYFGILNENKNKFPPGSKTG